MGALSLLTIIFAVAKSFEIVAWSWWLVFVPMQIEAMIGIVQWVARFVAIWRE